MTRIEDFNEMNEAFDPELEALVGRALKVEAPTDLADRIFAASMPEQAVMPADLVAVEARARGALKAGRVPEGLAGRIFEATVDLLPSPVIARIGAMMRMALAASIALVAGLIVHLVLSGPGPGTGTGTGPGTGPGTVPSNKTIANVEMPADPAAWAKVVAPAGIDHEIQALAMEVSALEFDTYALARADDMGSLGADDAADVEQLLLLLESQADSF